MVRIDNESIERITSELLRKLPTEEILEFEDYSDERLIRKLRKLPTK